MLLLRLVVLSMTLIPSLWAEQGGGSSISMAKRFSINMMDPFTRRSALDKNFVRFGRSGGGQTVNREGRAISDSFVRFGRGEEEDIDEDLPPRDLRGRTDFIRFGRGGSNSGFIRFGRGRQDNFIRFGKKDHEEPGSIKDDFQRFVRAGNGPKGHNTNFVRFGKRDPENGEEIVNAYKNGLSLDLDEFRKENLARIARVSNRHKGDSFIRFGRTPFYEEEFTPGSKDKYYSTLQNEEYNEDPQSSTGESEAEQPKSTATNPDSSNAYSSYEKTELSRKKRSTSEDHLELLPTDSPLLSPFYNYPSSLAAGFPNFIIGPELSVLPHYRNLGKKKIEDKNFIRLG